MSEQREEKVVLFDDVKKDIWKKRVKDTIDAAKNKALTAVNWAMDHPAEAAGLVASAGAIGTKLSRDHRVKLEQHRRETEHYDPRTGKYAVSRRKLTPREQLEAERRYKAGESWSEILYSMKLLK